MLVARVDVPSRRQLKITCGRRADAAKRAAKNRVTQEPESGTVSVDLAPVRVGCVEQVSQGTLCVVDLGLEEIPLPDHRRIQLEAGTDNKAPFVIGMTRCRA